MTNPEPVDDDDEVNLGPDETDRDLLDGTWEEDYYAGRVKTRDWRNVSIAISLLLLAAIVLSVGLLVQ
jgi:hypothetical protein